MRLLIVVLTCWALLVSSVAGAADAAAARPADGAQLSAELAAAQAAEDAWLSAEAVASRLVEEGRLSAEAAADAVEEAELAAGIPAEVAARDPYPVYRQLRWKILDGTVSVRDRPAFDVVLTRSSERRAAAEQLARLNGRHRRDALQRLHRILIRARADPDLLYGYLRRELREVLRAADRRPHRRGAAYAWGASYVLEAALTAYERTGQERFLTLARDSMLEILRQRDDRHGRVDQYRRRVLRTWGSTFEINGVPRFTNVVTHAGRIATPMARFAAIVRHRPELPAAHHRAGQQFLRAATDALAEFEGEFRTGDGGAYGYYWRTIANEREALNHQTSVGEALIYIVKAGGDRRWKVRARQITRFTRRVMYRDTNGTLVWRYNATPTNRRAGRAEAIWKAQVTIRFMILAEQSGMKFDRDTMREVARTIRVNVLRPEPVNLVISAERPQMQERYGGVRNLPAFLLLEPYDQRLGEELRRRLARQPRLGGWFTGQTSAAYAAGLPARG